MTTNAALAVAIAALLVASCGRGTGEEAGPGRDSATAEVACSEIGAIRFPTEYVAGPDLDRDAFAATAPGSLLGTFFGGGAGSPENHDFIGARGFSIVSDELVLGYAGDLPVSFFALDGDDVTGWGGCIPTLVMGDLVAYRWSLAAPVDSASTVVPIEIVGGACVTDSGTEEVTEIISVDVDEDADRVAVTVCVRDNMEAMGIEICAGVGHFQQTEADLGAPLGGRVLLDAGVVPASPPET